METSPKVFLAIPSALAMPSRDESREIKREQYVADFKQLALELRNQGYRVQCALEDCKWGNSGFDSPVKAIEDDWIHIKKCHHVIGCPTFLHEASGGVHIEIGWALAFRKPLTLLAAGNEYSHSLLVSGLAGIPRFNAKILYFRDRPKESFGSVYVRINELNGVLL